VILLNLGCGLAGAVATASYIQPNCAVLPGDAGAPPLVFFGDALRPASEQMANAGPGSLGAALRQIGIAPGPGLIHLGYLAPAAEGDFRAPDAAARAAAIRQFQSRTGLPADGQPSLSLLGYLIWAAQPPPVVG
jgi:hypothetical protein